MPLSRQNQGTVGRPFRYIRQDFFLARSFRNLDDLKWSYKFGPGVRAIA